MLEDFSSTCEAVIVPKPPRVRIPDRVVPEPQCARTGVDRDLVGVHLGFFQKRHHRRQLESRSGIIAAGQRIIEHFFVLVCRLFW